MPATPESHPIVTAMPVPTVKLYAMPESCPVMAANPENLPNLFKANIQCGGSTVPLMSVRAAGYESASEASPVHESAPVLLEMVASFAEPPKVVPPTFELTVCPVTAKEAIHELVACPVTAMEAVHELIVCPVTTKEAVYDNLPLMLQLWRLLKSSLLALSQSSGLSLSLLHYGFLICSRHPGVLLCQLHLGSMLPWI
ncbi:ATP-dependent 6-phosphofructokinase [Labeo rohita]|uniref:ATP-dependent 6-phosphofructokinase n=1 Tax=Labeo rohita TaxID=84645 RepID=A0ABQ8L979_LABRO|nr:ATP-dependent 6-phosphofructokinase [Labeo rohita]